MSYLIRTIENREGGSFEHRDNEGFGVEISIGRATDQDIQLTEPEIALGHAVIHLRGHGRGTIKASSSISPLYVNDKLVRSASLKPGDSVRIGDSMLEIIDPPGGFDFALTLERGGLAAEEDFVSPRSQYVTTLSEAGLSKRRWSWTLFLLVLIAFFVVPVSGLFDARLQAFLRSTPGVPSDGVWMTGAMIPAHSFPKLTGQCETCHVTPFVSVRDEQCMACHDDVADHAASDR